jgi:hypothetical protein
MQEQLGPFRNDNFSITDAQGRPFFNLQAAISFSSSRQLLDVYNAPILQMKKKMPSLRGSWLLHRASDGMRVATVRPSTFSFTPCELLVCYPQSSSLGFVRLSLFSSVGIGAAPLKESAYSAVGEYRSQSGMVPY